MLYVFISLHRVSYTLLYVGWSKTEEPHLPECLGRAEDFDMTPLTLDQQGQKQLTSLIMSHYSIQSKQDE